MTKSGRLPSESSRQSLTSLRLPIITTLRSDRPPGNNRPSGKTEYRSAWRGCESAGLHPQKITRSARLLTSPNVLVTSPASCNAMIDGPWQSDAVVSTTPRNCSASMIAARWPGVELRDSP